MQIKEFLLPEAVTSDLESSGKLDVLSELGKLLSGVCKGASEADIVAALVERERLATTGIGDGVAIPHAKSDKLTEIRGALGISRTGIPFDAVDGKPVHIFVALLAPQGVASEHLKALARISRLVREPDFRNRLMTTQSARELYQAIVEEDGK
ncbi:MAG: PTS sugar transporter subunit IIA [Deltaproteobacteria bacterium]|nr:PTS sugar transporter subunit IIA [Deltaproteobacteria bacterium]